MRTKRTIPAWFWVTGGERPHLKEINRFRLCQRKEGKHKAKGLIRFLELENEKGEKMSGKGFTRFSELENKKGGKNGY
jgi:hypothetical protein